MVRTLLIAGLLAAAATSPADARAPAARLALVDRTPLTLAGANFRRGERVRVTASAAGATRTRIVTASRRGTFVARFLAIRAPDPCSGGIFASATGSRGSRAVLHTPPPQCPPPQPVDR